MIEILPPREPTYLLFRYSKPGRLVQDCWVVFTSPKVRWNTLWQMLHLHVAFFFFEFPGPFFGRASKSAGRIQHEDAANVRIEPITGRSVREEGVSVGPSGGYYRLRILPSPGLILLLTVVASCSLAQKKTPEKKKGSRGQAFVFVQGVFRAKINLFRKKGVADPRRGPRAWHFILVAKSIFLCLASGNISFNKNTIQPSQSLVEAALGFLSFMRVATTSGRIPANSVILY